MDFTVVGNPCAAHQLNHQQSLSAGLRKHGLQVAEVATEFQVKTHRVACWGWRVGKRLREAGHSVLVMERGYIGDRFAWTSLGWNGLNNRATVPSVPDDGGGRFNANHAGCMKPLNPHGDYALLIGQVPGDASLQGLDLNPWYAQKAAVVAKETGLPVNFRPHPLARQRSQVSAVPGTQMLHGELSDALAGAAVVLTYNSNTGVDGLLAGKRVSADDKGSMAFAVTDREQWAHRLAWRQWSIEEIATGYALDHVGLTDG